MQVLRTPEARFADLADWPYAPRYVEIPERGAERPLRLHYVDEGPADARPVLLLHGEPSWGYLYRRVIAGLRARGRRAVAQTSSGSAGPTSRRCGRTTPTRPMSPG